MGLTHDPRDESPQRLTRRRLSETNAATALACFKQQSPPQPHLPEPWKTESWQSESRPPEIRPPPPPPPAPSAPVTMEQPLAPLQPASVQNYTTPGPFRKKQKYTIKNAEAWSERHGRPASYDPNGRALWKRPSDGQLVYLDCPMPGCGKSDFVTLHGFMCHLTKKHKNRSLGSQSRALELCGTVYDPDSPRPPQQQRERPTPDDGSRGGSEHIEADDDDDESAALSSPPQDNEEVTTQQTEPDNAESAATSPNVREASPSRVNSTMKPTIAAMIDPPESESELDRKASPAATNWPSNL